MKSNWFCNCYTFILQNMKISTDRIQRTGTCTCKNCTCTSTRTRCRSQPHYYLEICLCLHFYQNTGSKFLSIVNYSWYCKANIFEISGQVVDSKVQEPQHLCHVLTTGVFPVMAVSDARCYGSAVGISKKQLWALFSLDKYVFHWPVIHSFLSCFWNQSIW